MAAAIKVFLLFIGVVIVKSHHLHRIHHRLHDRLGIHDLLSKIFHPGVTGFFGTGFFDTGSLGNEDGHGPVADIGKGDNHVSLHTWTHNGNYGQGTVVPNQNHYNIEIPNQPTSDVNLNIGAPNLNGRANVNNANGQSDEPQHGPNVDRQADTNQSQLNIASDNVVKQNINNDAGLNTASENDAAQGLISQNNPNEKKDLMGNDKKAPGFTSDNINMGTSTDEPKLTVVQPIDSKLVPGFHNDEIKNGVLIINPEFKINETGAVMDKFSYIVVFPDDENRAKELKQNNVQQSLPNRINTNDNNNQYPSVVTPGVGSTAAPPTNNIQWITPNNVAQTIPSENNQSTQNQPSNVVFVQNPNQQVPVNNGNGFPYVHVNRDSNGGYTILNTPNNNGNADQIYVPGNGNSGVNNPGQSYVITDTGNSEVTSKPGQIYVSGNSGTKNPGLSYILVNGNSGVSNPGQTYVITDTGNSGVNSNPGQIYLSGNSGTYNPGQTYVIADTGNSGVNSKPGQIYLSRNSGTNNPGQTYVITDTGNSGVNSKPGQIYTSGNFGTNNPGLIYVPGNSVANNPSQIYVPTNVPSSGSQTAGGYYNIIHLNNGQTVLVPVNNGQNYGNGQNTQWNGQPNNGPIYVPVNNNPIQGYKVLGNNPTGSVVTLGNAGGTGGSTNNVPLLVSYKDKDGEDEEMSEKLKDEKSK